MKGALRLFYPPQCLACGDSVDTDGGLCGHCWGEARFIAGLACDCCGAPLPDDGSGVVDDGPVGTDCGAAICDDCLHAPPAWQRGRAVMTYGGTGRSLVLALKHGDRADLAPALGRWLAEAAGPLIRPGMIVAPVPVHWRRLMRRKYNQAELLSAQLARLRGLPHCPGLLTRLRHTPGQDHRSVAERYDNLDGAIGVAPALANVARGKPVLLVDDVMTSGASLNACTQALIEAGAGPVSVVVLARAVRND